nr:MAG TPA: hypothetical protein [Caudoviricetes sp.]
MSLRNKRRYDGSNNFYCTNMCSVFMLFIHFDKNGFQLESLLRAAAWFGFVVFGIVLFGRIIK